MKKSLTDYASALAESNIDILEELIDKKYRKFVKLFQLIKDYSDDILKMKYEFSDIDTLSIQITFDKSIKMDDKKDLIAEMKQSGYIVKSKLTGKKMKLEIEHKE